MKIAYEVVGGEFEIPEDRKKIISNLMKYFIGEENDLDLSKGIAIVGSYGVGKSTIFQIFHELLKRYFPFNKNMFRISSIEEVITEMKASDFMKSKILYNNQQNALGVDRAQPIHVLINEFGHKYQVKDYGTDVNEIIDMFIMKRYDIFQQNKKLLHITTNYDLKELKSTFDARIFDRFKEMFNVIEFKGKSYRK